MFRVIALAFAIIALALFAVYFMSVDSPPEPRPINEKGHAQEISTLFPPAVQYWEEDLVRWSGNDIPPNFLATIMLMESCGDPIIANDTDPSVGLFQIVADSWGNPSKEYLLDPEINATSATAELRWLADYTNGYNIKTFAAYNGGLHALLTIDWDELPAKRYAETAWKIYEASNAPDPLGYYTEIEKYKFVCARSARKLNIL